MLHPRDGVLVLHLLLWPDEVRKPRFSFLRDDITPRPARAAGGRGLHPHAVRHPDPHDMVDRYQAALKELVEAKVAGRQLEQPPAPAHADSADDLMEALRRSVEQAKHDRGTVARPRGRRGSARRSAPAEAGRHQVRRSTATDPGQEDHGQQAEPGQEDGGEEEHRGRLARSAAFAWPGRCGAQPRGPAPDRGDPHVAVLAPQGRPGARDPEDYSGGPGHQGLLRPTGQRRLAPDDPRKPGSPTDLGRRTWLGVAKRAFTEFKDDNITDWAAALTYYAVLSIFPGVIVFVSLLGLFGQGPETVDKLLDIVGEIGVAAGALDTFAGPIEDVVNSRPARPARADARPARRAVVGLRLHRRVHPRVERDLRGARRAASSTSCGRCRSSSRSSACCCSPRSRWP